MKFNSSKIRTSLVVLLILVFSLAPVFADNPSGTVLIEGKLDEEVIVSNPDATVSPTGDVGVDGFKLEKVEGFMALFKGEEGGHTLDLSTYTNSVFAQIKEGAGSQYGAGLNNTTIIDDEISNNFIQNFVHSIGSSARGGALSNTGNITSIFSSFVFNGALGNMSALGGAIYNDYNRKNQQAAVIGSIRGEFITNFVFSDYKNVYGGAIYNIGQIGNVQANFKYNIAQANSGNAGGGAIFNAEVPENTKIGNIKGDFIGNKAIATHVGIAIAAEGGAIYNTQAIGVGAGLEDDFDVSTYGYGIQGNFEGNYAIAKNRANQGDARGGAIYNAGTDAKISSISGDFKDNYAESFLTEDNSPNSVALGGAIYNADAHIGRIDGDFIRNKAKATKNNLALGAAGGAIYNGSGTIGVISGSFVGNTADYSANSQVGTSNLPSQGGAIYNGKYSQIKSVSATDHKSTYSTELVGQEIDVLYYGANLESDSIFTNEMNEGSIVKTRTVKDTDIFFAENYASEGGAIFNQEVMQLEADQGDIYFMNNNAGSTSPISDAIYNGSGAVLTMLADNDGEGKVRAISFVRTDNDGQEAIYNQGTIYINMVAQNQGDSVTDMEMTALESARSSENPDPKLHNGVVNLLAVTGDYGVLEIGKGTVNASDVLKQAAITIRGEDGLEEWATLNIDASNFGTSQNKTKIVSSGIINLYDGSFGGSAGSKNTLLNSINDTSNREHTSDYNSLGTKGTINVIFGNNVVVASSSTSNSYYVYQKQLNIQDNASFSIDASMMHIAEINISKNLGILKLTSNQKETYGLPDSFKSTIKEVGTAASPNRAKLNIKGYVKLADGTLDIPVLVDSGAYFHSDVDRFSKNSPIENNGVLVLESSNQDESEPGNPAFDIEKDALANASGALGDSGVTGSGITVIKDGSSVLFKVPVDNDVRVSSTASLKTAPGYLLKDVKTNGWSGLSASSYEYGGGKVYLLGGQSAEDPMGILNVDIKGVRSTESHPGSNGGSVTIESGIVTIGKKGTAPSQTDTVIDESSLIIKEGATLNAPVSSIILSTPNETVSTLDNYNNIQNLGTLNLTPGSGTNAGFIYGINSDSSTNSYSTKTKDKGTTNLSGGVFTLYHGKSGDSSYGTEYISQKYLNVAADSTLTVSADGLNVSTEVKNAGVIKLAPYTYSTIATTRPVSNLSSSIGLADDPNGTNTSKVEILSFNRTGDSESYPTADGMVVLAEDAKITQKNLTIASGAHLKAGADKLVISQAIANSGELRLTGSTLASSVTSTGETNIQGNVTFDSSITVSQKVGIGAGSTLTTDANSLGKGLADDITVTYKEFTQYDGGNAADGGTGTLKLTGGVLDRDVENLSTNQLIQTVIAEGSKVAVSSKTNYEREIDKLQLEKDSILSLSSDPGNLYAGDKLKVQTLVIPTGDYSAGVSFDVGPSGLNFPEDVTNDQIIIDSSKQSNLYGNINLKTINVTEDFYAPIKPEYSDYTYATLPEGHISDTYTPAGGGATITYDKTSYDEAINKYYGLTSATPTIDTQRRVIELFKFDGNGKFDNVENGSFDSTNNQRLVINSQNALRGSYLYQFRQYIPTAYATNENPSDDSTGEGVTNWTLGSLVVERYKVSEMSLQDVVQATTELDTGTSNRKVVVNSYTLSRNEVLDVAPTGKDSPKLGVLGRYFDASRDLTIFGIGKRSIWNSDHYEDKEDNVFTINGFGGTQNGVTIANIGDKITFEDVSLFNFSGSIVTNLLGEANFIARKIKPGTTVSPNGTEGYEGYDPGFTPTYTTEDDYNVHISVNNGTPYYLENSNGGTIRLLAYVDKSVASSPKVHGIKFETDGENPTDAVILNKGELVINGTFDGLNYDGNVYLTGVDGYVEEGVNLGNITVNAGNVESTGNIRQSSVTNAEGSTFVIGSSTKSANLNLIKREGNALTNLGTLTVNGITNILGNVSNSGTLNLNGSDANLTNSFEADVTNSGTLNIVGNTTITGKLKNTKDAVFGNAIVTKKTKSDTENENVYAISEINRNNMTVSLATVDNENTLFFNDGTYRIDTIVDESESKNGSLLVIGKVDEGFTFTQNNPEGDSDYVKVTVTGDLVQKDVNVRADGKLTINANNLSVTGEVNNHGKVVLTTETSETTETLNSSIVETLPEPSTGLQKTGSVEISGNIQVGDKGKINNAYVLEESTLSLNANKLSPQSATEDAHVTIAGNSGKIVLIGNDGILDAVLSGNVEIAENAVVEASHITREVGISGYKKGEDSPISVEEFNNITDLTLKEGYTKVYQATDGNLKNATLTNLGTMKLTGNIEQNITGTGTIELQSVDSYLLNGVSIETGIIDGTKSTTSISIRDFDNDNSTYKYTAGTGVFTLGGIKGINNFELTADMQTTNEKVGTGIDKFVFKGSSVLEEGEKAIFNIKNINIATDSLLGDCPEGSEESYDDYLTFATTDGGSFDNIDFTIGYDAGTKTQVGSLTEIEYGTDKNGSSGGREYTFTLSETKGKLNVVISDVNIKLETFLTGEKGTKATVFNLNNVDSDYGYTWEQKLGTLDEDGKKHVVTNLGDGRSGTPIIKEFYINFNGGKYLKGTVDNVKQEGIVVANNLDLVVTGKDQVGRITGFDTAITVEQGSALYLENMKFSNKVSERSTVSESTEDVGQLKLENNVDIANDGSIYLIGNNILKSVTKASDSSAEATLYILPGESGTSVTFTPGSHETTDEAIIDQNSVVVYKDAVVNFEATYDDNKLDEYVLIKSDVSNAGTLNIDGGKLAGDLYEILQLDMKEVDDTDKPLTWMKISDNSQELSNDAYQALDDTHKELYKVKDYAKKLVKVNKTSIANINGDFTVVEDLSEDGFYILQQNINVADGVTFTIEKNNKMDVGERKLQKESDSKLTGLEVTMNGAVFHGAGTLDNDGYINVYQARTGSIFNIGEIKDSGDSDGKRNGVIRFWIENKSQPFTLDTKVTQKTVMFDHANLVEEEASAKISKAIEANIENRLIDSESTTTTREGLTIGANVTGNITNIVYDKEISLSSYDSRDVETPVLAFESNKLINVEGIINNSGKVFVEANTTANGLINSLEEKSRIVNGVEQEPELFIGTVEIDSSKKFTVEDSFDNSSVIYNEGTLVLGTTETHNNMTNSGVIYNNIDDTSKNDSISIYSKLDNSEGYIQTENLAIEHGGSLTTRLDDLHITNADNKVTNSGTLNITAIGPVYLDDYASDGNEKKVHKANEITLNITSTETGVVDIATGEDVMISSTLENQVVKFHSGTMTFGYGDEHNLHIVGDNAGLHIMDGAKEINLKDDVSGITTYGFGKVTLDTSINMPMDFKLKDEIKMDQIKVTGSEVKNGAMITVSGLPAKEEYILRKADIDLDPFADDVSRAALKDYIQVDETYRVLSPIFKYHVDYDEELGLIHLNGGKNYDGFNPGIYDGMVAALTGGLLSEINSFDEAFLYEDTRLMTGISGKREKAGITARGYGLRENLELVPEGPRVNNSMYGAYADIDTNVMGGNNIWTSTLSGYATYDGSRQTYDGVSLQQNGAHFGGKAFFYRDNFYVGATANLGFNNIDAKTAFGDDEFAQFMGGTAVKIGFNWTLDDKITFQPNWQLSQVHVKTYDYIGAPGVEVSDKPFNAMQLAAGFKFVDNFKKHNSKFYSDVEFVYTNGNPEFYADGIELATLGFKPYIQLNVGFEKTWTKHLMGYVQAGGKLWSREGLSVTAGFKLVF